MPHLIRKFRQLDALDLSLPLFVKEAQLDLGRVCGKQCEIDAKARPGRAQRKSASLAQSGSLQRGSVLEFKLSFHLRSPMRAARAEICRAGSDGTMIITLTLARQSSVCLSKLCADGARASRCNFDLYGAALLAPQFNSRARARSKRHAAFGRPHPDAARYRSNFDLAFQVIGNQWRLYGISIATPEAAPAQPQTQAPPARPSTPAAHE